MKNCGMGNHQLVFDVHKDDDDDVIYDVVGCDKCDLFYTEYDGDLDYVEEWWDATVTIPESSPSP